MNRRSKAEVDEEIDRSLKRAFEELASEPLPDRFTQLLDRLKAGGGAGVDAKAADDDGSANGPGRERGPG